MGACHTTENPSVSHNRDEDEDHVLHSDNPESQDDECARSVRQPAVLALLQTRIRDFAGPQCLPLDLTGCLLNLETCVTSGETRWCGVLGWPLWCLKLVNVTNFLTMVDAFSSNRLSNCRM